MTSVVICPFLKFNIHLQHGQVAIYYLILIKLHSDNNVAGYKSYGVESCNFSSDSCKFL